VAAAFQRLRPGLATDKSNEKSGKATLSLGLAGRGEFRLLPAPAR
jgi:hypothetical protein